MSTETIGGRYEEICRRVASACDAAGRAPGEVHLVAISKKQSPAVIREAAECGISVFGENRVQEAAAKIPECPEGLSWHLVGHLQGNKVQSAAELFDVIHSIDSLRLLQRMNAACAEAGRTISVLLQVSVSGEASKFGLAPEEVPLILEASIQCMSLDVVGLMTIPPFTPNPEGSAPHFAHLRKLRDQWRASTGIPLDELSMGMSHDFEIAIREGATTIRIGTALLGARKD
jgi:pyridoxal phosphate enzyme (YggS family)